jgi:hypothetical protein
LRTTVSFRVVLFRAGADFPRPEDRDEDREEL